VEAHDDQFMSSEWASLQISPSFCKIIAHEVAKLLEVSIHFVLTGQKTREFETIDDRILQSIWKSVSLLATETHSPQLMIKLAGMITKIIKEQNIGPPSKTNLTKVPTQQPHPKTISPSPAPAQPNQQGFNVPPSPVPSDPALPKASPWKYLPVPKGPDQHEEYDFRTFSSPQDFHLFGARVRGKKHKHDGTNCDDWFEAGRSGDWSIIAVSDGAGSKVFSRVGAKSACKAALDYLTRNLKTLAPPKFTLAEWEHNLKDKESGIFFNPFLSESAKAIQVAMNSAFEAVRLACEERRESGRSEPYTALLGRPIEINDLSATLLLLVHRVVEVEGIPFDFVMACQIGDGISAAIDQKGEVHLLGKSDGGSFSGETEFLTSKGKLEPVNLHAKTYAMVNQLQTILVMTDGVADDYFPNDPGIGCLWADLLLNRIPDVIRNPSSISFNTPEFDMSLCDEASEIINSNKTRPEIILRSATKLAKLLNIPLEIMVKKTSEMYALSCPAIQDLLGQNSKPADRLRLWLDTYTIRGSFDDRTLVVLHRETLP